MSNALRLFGFGLGLGLVAGGCSAETEDPGTSNMARVRVAHLSPDAPAVDFCIAPAGTQAFAGPVLASVGALIGIAYGHVNKYLELEPQQYDVRLVNVGAQDCTKGLGPDTTNLPALPAGASATIAAIGKISHGTGATGFALRAYVDEASVDGDKAKLRFVHASPGTPNVDVGLGGGLLFTPVFTNTAYGDASQYITTAPIDGAEISARATGATSDVIAIKPASLPAGKIATAFAIGELDGESKMPLKVLLCVDNSEHGLETECNTVGAAPERARIRVAHLSPDAPAVDVCIATAGGAYPDKPLLASFDSRAGLSYTQVTKYLELPAGTYDVRIVLASETSCANKAVPDTTGITLPAGLTGTVGAIGTLAGSSFRLGIFPDATAVASGKARLRFVHASPGTPNVDIGIKDAHGNFSALFLNVAFGNAASLETAPLTATVAARATGTTADALVVPGVSLADGDIKSAIAIGILGSTHTPLRVLLCSDNAAPSSLLASCVTAP
jgi:hypothetical protein